jgi:hypothetical protein
VIVNTACIEESSRSWTHSGVSVGSIVSRAETSTPELVIGETKIVEAVVWSSASKCKVPSGMLPPSPTRWPVLIGGA